MCRWNVNMESPDVINPLSFEHSRSNIIWIFILFMGEMLKHAPIMRNIFSYFLWRNEQSTFPWYFPDNIFKCHEKEPRTTQTFFIEWNIACMRCLSLWIREYTHLSWHRSVLLFTVRTFEYRLDGVPVPKGNDGVKSLTFKKLFKKRFFHLRRS